MSNWLLKCAEDYLVPIYDKLRAQLLQREVLHADETTLQVLHEESKKPQSKSYMWLYRTGGDANHPTVLYEYQPDRKAEQRRVLSHQLDRRGWNDIRFNLYSLIRIKG